MKLRPVPSCGTCTRITSIKEKAATLLLQDRSDSFQEDSPIRDCKGMVFQQQQIKTMLGLVVQLCREGIEMEAGKCPGRGG